MIKSRFLSEEELQKLLIEANVTEIEIMEYADGVLAAKRRPAVRTALATFPDLMQLLESFLFTRGPVADAFAGVYAQSPSEQLIARLEEAERPPAKPRRRLFGFSSPSARPFKFKFRAPVVTVAALAAVVLTAGLTSYAVRYDFIPPDRQGAAVPPLLQQALESTPMGETARLTKHSSVEMKLTFFSRLQIWCREFGQIYGDRMFWVGQIACRGNDGVWRAHATTHALLLRDANMLVGEEGAGLLARARDNLKHRKDGEMLGPEKEKPLIENHWQGKP